MMKSNERKAEVQKGESGTVVVQSQEATRPVSVPRLGRTHQDYWQKRLVKRSYESDGETITIQSWQVRIAHLGRREWFNLDCNNKTDAAVKARNIFLSLVSEGWEKSLARYKPAMVVARGDMTITEFSEFYREAVEKVEDPPSKPTLERYLKGLSFLCRAVHVRRVSGLTPEKIKEFRGNYLADGRREKRDPESVKVSCNAVLRNAGALFSKQMLAQYHAMGLQATNPFLGQKLRGVEIKPYSALLPEKLNLIWKDAGKLRDGDPDAPEIQKNKGGRPKKGEQRKKAEKRKRWVMAHDFGPPHLAEYAILLLELGLGLRRNEADKAEKQWFWTDASGRHFITVKQTQFFTPKSKESRDIPVDGPLYDAIKAVMDGHVSPFVVPGPLPKQHSFKDSPKNLVYRLDRHHRNLTAWLRQRGINDDKPCHRLRKEFGSFVATSFGLFHAQRFLGHSSPAVTEAFYAALTNMPVLGNSTGRITEQKKGSA
jgi:integrase